VILIAEDTAWSSSWWWRRNDHRILKKGVRARPRRAKRRRSTYRTLCVAVHP